METMMNTEPAFPTNGSNYERDYSAPGMTLRDYFAGLAMQGLIASPRPPGHARENQNYYADEYAVLAYSVADAMLAARTASPTGEPA
jgi:hypothetical protein